MGSNKSMAGMHATDLAQRVIEADIREELDAHLDLATASGVDEGLTAQEARAQALARFGDLEQTVRACSREKLGGLLMWKRVALIGMVLAVVLSGVIATLAVRAQEAREQVDMASLIAVLDTEAPEPLEIVVHVGDRLELHDGYQQFGVGETYAVDRDGTALLPTLGHVDVAGLTRAELEVLLRELYSPYYEQLDLYARVLEG